MRESNTKVRGARAWARETVIEVTLKAKVADVKFSHRPVLELN